jgi:VanZ family protein
VKRKLTGGVLILATLLWVVVIWGHSMVPANLSSQESGWVLSVVEKLFGLLHIPEGVTEHLVRKTAHFTEYCILGVLISLDLRKMPWRQRIPLCLLAGLFVPMVDETIQLFVPGRSGELKDAWLDVSGFLVGVILTKILRSLYHLHQKHRYGNDIAK